MLYRVFKWLFYLTVRGYFRSIHIQGRSNIPLTGPVVFVVNHNSAFMDPILLAVHIDRSLYFLARGESFKSRLASMFFGWLHMIPIYRPEITPDEVHKNKMIFQRCFDHLKKGKAIMVFPEGVSETVRGVRHIKTGTARIVLGAEQQNEFKLGVKIVPIGINYSNPHYFWSDVYISIGNPFQVDKYQQQYSEDPKAVVRQVTDQIKSSLEKQLVGVLDQSTDQLIRDIERLYRSDLRERMPQEHKASQDFYLSKEIVQAVNYNLKTRPEVASEFQEKIRSYLETIDMMNISDAEFRKYGRHTRLWRTPYFILGFPILIYGLIVNIIPYKTAEFLSRKIIVRKDFIGSMKLAFGMFVFLIFYIIQIFIVTSLTTWMWGLLFALSLYPCGLFAVNYVNQLYRFRAHLTYLKLKTREKHALDQMHAIREELLKELDIGRELYLNSKVN